MCTACGCIQPGQQQSKVGPLFHLGTLVGDVQLTKEAEPTDEGTHYQEHNLAVNNAEAHHAHLQPLKSSAAHVAKEKWRMSEGTLPGCSVKLLSPNQDGCDPGRPHIHTPNEGIIYRNTDTCCSCCPCSSSFQHCMIDTSFLVWILFFHDYLYPIPGTLNSFSHTETIWQRQLNAFNFASYFIPVQGRRSTNKRGTYQTKCVRLMSEYINGPSVPHGTL